MSAVTEGVCGVTKGQNVKYCKGLSSIMQLVTSNTMHVLLNTYLYATKTLIINDHLD